MRPEAWWSIPLAAFIVSLMTAIVSWRTNYVRQLREERDDHAQENERLQRKLDRALEQVEELQKENYNMLKIREKERRDAAPNC